ncbi:MAG TPA: Gfo/Idh/MocA family oxidoreductase [Acidimicrobiia bacterium]|nr:Gfo/Idh/MocA family oxidoreductase [Acidimicrobiia bacterium]
MSEGSARSRQLRFGVIGTGLMGCEHLRNLLALPGAEVAAVCDRNEESRYWARLTIGEQHPPRACETVKEALDADLDAVVIATPNFTHGEVLHEVFAARPDLPVLVEKPLCTTVADCRAVERAAADRPAMVWVGLEYRFMPPVARFLQEVRGGAVGTLHMISVREHRFPFLPKVDNWNRFNENTGGTLVEKCCHFFDLMRLAAQSDPVRVLASGAQSVNHVDERYDGRQPDILDNAYVIVEFASGARGCLDLCMFAEASRNEQELCAAGDAGKVEAFVPEALVRIGDRATRQVREIATSQDERVRHTGFHHGASYLELAAFADAIRTGASPAVTVADGTWAVATGQAAHLSIDEARPVLLAEL